MTKFPKALSAWNTEVFDDVLRMEIKSLGINSLPLGGYVDDERVATLILLSAVDVGIVIQCKVGIWFDEMLSCCGNPSGAMKRATYCEVQIRIDKSTAEADAEFVVTSD